MDKKSITLFDVHIDDVVLAEAITLVDHWLNSQTFHQVVTPGPEFLLESTANKDFHRILNRSDLSLPDGMGVYLAARIIGRPLRHRITGVDFILALMAHAAKQGSRVFLFGGQPGAADKAAEKLLQQHPGLAIVGIESGYRGPWQKLHDHQIIKKIRLAKPDILLVALGAPKQELWIDRHRQALHNVKIAIGVGRTFDYLAGIVTRAPKTMQKLGLEWLHTFFTANQYYQPQKRRQRIVNATWHFSREFARRHLNGKKH